MIPVVLLVVGLMHYGQPIFEQFREFLDHSIEEVVRRSEELEVNPERSFPFDQIHQELDHIHLRQSLSDTEAHRVRLTTSHLHRAMVRRIALQLSEDEIPQQVEAYSNLLDHPLHERVFPNWSELKPILLDDVEDVRRARTLPVDPTLPVEGFVNAADTAAGLIDRYANRYAGPERCRALAQLGCDRLFGASAEEVGRFLERYAERWPRFTFRASDQPESLRQMVEEIMDVSSLLRDDLPRYFRSRPWSELPFVPSAFQQLDRSFHTSLRNWYATLLEDLPLARESFDPSLSSIQRDHLREALALETDLREHPDGRRVLLREPALEPHEEFVRRLETIHLWVQVRREHDPDSAVDERDLQLVEDLLAAQPEGERRIRQLGERRETIEQTLTDLGETLNNRNYDRMIELLTNLDENRLSNPMEGPAWRIITEEFLSSALPRVDEPDWQPRTPEEEERYVELVHLFREISSDRGFGMVDEAWVDQTLLAMRDQRFNQLRVDVRNLMSDLTEQTRDELVDRLREFFSIEELPDELRRQADWLVLEAALVERFRLGSRRVRDGVEEPFLRNESIETLWSEGRTLAAELQTEPDRDRLTDLTGTLVEPLVNWYENLTDRPIRGDLFETVLIEEVAETFNRFSSWSVGRIREVPDLEESRALSREELVGLREAQDQLRQSEPFRSLELRRNLLPWINLLDFREQIRSLAEAVDRLERGGTFGDNTSYNRFLDTLDPTISSPLPEEYDFTTEVAALESMQEELLNRAQTFQREAEEQWFGGARGLTGSEVVGPWSDYLAGVQSRLPRRESRSELQLLQADLIELREGWE